MFKESTLFLLLLTATATAQPEPRDPALAGYVDLAVRHNRELLARSQDVDARVEAVTEVRAGYLPTVTLDVRYTRVTGGLDLGALINPAYATLNQLVGEERFPTDLSLVLPLALDAKVRVAQPLYAPALGPATRLAKLGADAERAQRRIARREIVAAVGGVYYGHARAALLADLLRQTRPLLEENLAVSTALVAARKATDDVVLRAQAELAAHDQRLRVAEQGRRAAARALAVLIAAPLDAEVVAPASLSVPAVPIDVAPLIARARRARGEVDLAGIAAGAAGEQQALARSGQRPTVALAVDLGVQRPDLGLSVDDTYASITLLSSWTVFAGGREPSRVRQLGHTRRALELRRAQLADQVAAEVTTAWESAQVARAAVAAADQRIASTQAAYDIIARRYAASDVPQLEVLVALNGLIGARTDRVVAITELYARLVELDRVIATEEVSP